MKKYLRSRSEYGLPRIAVLCVILLSVLCAGARCQITYSPVQPGDSSTLPGRIARGEVICMPFHGITLWSGDQLFTSFCGLKVQSDNNSYNLVIPKDGKTDELSTLYDMDYMVMGDPPVYSSVNLNSLYKFSFPGDPAFTCLYETLYEDFAPYKLMSRDYYGKNTGTYNIRCNVYDFGTVPFWGSGSVCDAANSTVPAGGFDYNLYIVDFVYHEGILPCNNTAVPISLQYTPSALPNMPNLSITVEWSGLNSNLYEDSTCLSMINGNGNQKTWSASSAPSVIYFKKASGDISAQQFKVTLVATVTLLGTETRKIIEKKLQANGSFFVTSVEGGGSDGSDLRGFWTSFDQLYPHPEWQDGSNPLDGDAQDAPGMTTVDVNRPFLYRITDNFKIHNVTIAHDDGITYSSSDYYFRAVSDDGRLNINYGSFSDANGEISAYNLIGSVFDRITCNNVSIRWSLVERSTGVEIILGKTTHKVYAIAANYEGVPYHTLVELACSAARDMLPSDTASLFEALWDKICSLSIYREDGNLLTYYGNGWLTGGDLQYTALLLNTDGQCHAWADLMKEAGALLGLEMDVKKLSFLDILPQQNLGSYCGFLQSSNIVQGGVAALTVSGNPSEKGFVWHAVVEYLGQVYDPSTGVKADDIEDYVLRNIKLFFSFNTDLPVSPSGFLNHIDYVDSPYEN